MADARTQLSLTGRRWTWPPELPAPSGPSTLPLWLTALLSRRGITGPAEISRYLEPSLSSLDDPSLMADMDRAVARLLEALDQEQPITVYGDYDVDGVGSTTILVEFLRKVGANVSFYIPDRRVEGYGLNLGAVEELAHKCRLLITADCGVTAVAEIARARELGLDVIVVDHHKVGAELPAANAVLDPQRADCRFPFKGMCATGVAFVLLMALRRALRERGAFTSRPEPDLRELLDVVALATVADMVPVQGANRVLVASGLRRMAAAPRVGIAALMQVANVDRARLSTTDIGFRVAPRINARGRLAHAGEAVELLLTQDVARATALAQALDEANQERRDVERKTLDRALAQVEQRGPEASAALVLHDDSWHPGVLGLVASRLVQRYRRPVIVIGEGGKGSGRTLEGLDLHAAIAEASEHLLRFGGHHAAAGVTCAPASVSAFRDRFIAAVEARLGPPPYVPELRLDLEVQERDLSLDMVGALQRLAPFGQENPEPLFVARGLRVTDKRIVGDNHLKLRLGGLDAIAWNLGQLRPSLPDTVDAAFRLERNVFRGKSSLQLSVEDLRHAH